MGLPPMARRCDTFLLRPGDISGIGIVFHAAVSAGVGSLEKKKQNINQHIRTYTYLTKLLTIIFLTFHGVTVQLEVFGSSWERVKEGSRWESPGVSGRVEEGITGRVEEGITGRVKEGSS